MGWQIEIKKSAAKQIQKLDAVVQKRIVSFLGQLATSVNPRLSGKALKGEKGELWRYRVGDYRLICQLQDSQMIVLVLVVGHRKEVYR